MRRRDRLRRLLCQLRCATLAWPTHYIGAINMPNGLSSQEVAKLLGIAPVDIQQEVAIKLDECKDILRTKIAPSGLHLMLPLPVVVFDLRGTTAGQAWGDSKIRLNVDLLLSEHREHMLNQTVPHEYAHCVVEANWPKAQSHGREWKWVMSMLGLRPDRTHNMPVKKVRHHPRNHGYNCACRTHYVTNLIHKRIQAGQVRYCRNCDTEITKLSYVGEQEHETN